MSCKFCQDTGIQWQGCCSGQECGCGGLPVQATNCPACNAENDKVNLDAWGKQVLDNIEWVPDAAWAKGKLPQLVTCRGKGGLYRVLGTSTGAGTSRGETRVVYQDTLTDRIFHRELEDFNARMENV